MLLRPAEPGDTDEVAGVHVRSWQVGYRGLLPDDYLDSLRPEDRAKRYAFAAADPALPTTIVAVNNGAICGFATTAPTRDDDVPGHGASYALYVDPSCWALGVGRALISAARERLARDRFADAVLWVLVGNERAERFYRLDGWLPDGSSRIAEVWGAAVDEVRYRRHLT